MTNFNSTRNWLNRNKIFFETLATVSLTVMAVLVSCKSNSIAENANAISRIDHQPKIYAHFKTVISDNGKRDEMLTITNSGDVMYDFKSYEFQYLRLSEMQIVSKENSTYPQRLKNKKIPLINYYSPLTFISQEMKGEFSNTKVNDDSNFEKSLEDFSIDHKSRTKSIGATIERYLEITYKDQFNEKKTYFLRFDYAGNSSPMNEQEGEDLKRIFERSLKTGKGYVDYSTLIKSELDKLWNED